MAWRSPDGDTIQAALAARFDSLWLLSKDPRDVEAYS